jgi:hypothetical protein
MKSAITIQQEPQCLVDLTEKHEAQDIHDFESVGDILRRMFAQANADAPPLEDPK